MISLNKEQSDFLNKHWLSDNMIFDATGMKRREYKKAMEELDKQIAIGTTPCNKWWHTMRTKAWHCLQCKPECISFIRNRYNEAVVYVAASKNWQLMKVGSTSDVRNRHKDLNSNKYAWLNDRVLVYVAKYPNAWEVEKRIHNKLAKYWHKHEYNFYWKNMISYEIFHCSFTKVIQTINLVKSEIGITKLDHEWILTQAATIYNFPDIDHDLKRF